MTRFVARYVPPEMAALWVFELLLTAAGIDALIGGWPGGDGGAGLATEFGRLPHAVVIAAIIAGSGLLIGLYRTEICLQRRRLVLNAAIAAIIAFPVALVVGGQFSAGISHVYAIWLVKVLALWLGFVVFSRQVLRRAFARRLFVRRIVVVGPAAAAACEQVRRHAPGRFELLVAEPDAPDRDSVPAVASAAGGHRVWAILVADPPAQAPRDTLVPSDPPVAPAPADPRLRGVRMFSLAGFWEHCLGRVNLDRLDRAWFLSGDGFADHRFGVLAKRALDLSVSLVLLVLTFPLMLMVALAVKLDSPGPVLYRQRRVGLHGRVFTLLKFRSMRADAEAGGTPRWAARKDDRVTRVGRLIRSTRIDELPQLLNVLTGDMSLVGPRPERPHFVEQLTAVIPFYAERARVKPGITGWAQVKYPYGASVEDAREKLSFDLYYLKNRGLLLDLLILISTFRVILFREGAR